MQPVENTYSIAPYFSVLPEIQGKIFVETGLKSFLALRACSEELCKKVDAATETWKAFCVHLKLGHCLSDTKNWKRLLISQILQNRNMKLNPENLACRYSTEKIQAITINGKVFKFEPGKLTMIDNDRDEKPETIRTPNDEAYLKQLDDDYFVTSSSSHFEGDFVTLKRGDSLTVWNKKLPIMKYNEPGSYTIQDEMLIQITQEILYRDVADQKNICFVSLKNFADKRSLTVLNEATYIGRVANVVMTFVKTGLVVYDLNNNVNNFTCPFPEGFAINSRIDLRFQYSRDYIMVCDTSGQYWYTSLIKPSFQLFGKFSLDCQPQLVRNCVYSYDGKILRQNNLTHNTSQTYETDAQVRKMLVYGDRLIALFSDEMNAGKCVVFETNSTVSLFKFAVSYGNRISVHSGILYCGMATGFSFWNLENGQKIGVNLKGMGGASNGGVYCYQKSTFYNYMRIKSLDHVPPEINYDAVIPEPFQLPQNNSLWGKIQRFGNSLWE